jgi:DUF1009 family protein
MTLDPPRTDFAVTPPPEAGWVGLVAGAGRFPIAFARAARKQGLKVYGLGVHGMVSDDLADSCDRFATAGLGRMGKAIRLFNRAGIRDVVMAGKIEKLELFKPARLLRLLPDWRTLHMWFRYATANKSDDTILLAIIKEFGRDGIRFHSALDFCPELLVNHGFLTRRKPSTAQWRDIKFGWDIAKDIGRLDIGQTVVVNDMAVIAVEAIEGTDQAIRRAGSLCRRGGFTVVKVAKPQQDRRFDVPTVGLDTVQTMYEAGARVLAIESQRTILLDGNDSIALADRLGIAIVALNADELQLRVAS